MENKSFWINLNLDGKDCRLEVIAENNELDTIYVVELPDGKERKFYTFEVDNESAWAEMDKGVTDLSVKVGAAIDRVINNAG